MTINGVAAGSKMIFIVSRGLPYHKVCTIVTKQLVWVVILTSVYFGDLWFQKCKLCIMGLGSCVSFGYASLIPGLSLE